jgi:FtsZ-binding cell division protein ZapB
MDNLHGKQLAYSYINKIVRNTRPSVDDIKILITEIVRLEDKKEYYEYIYHSQLLKNNSLQRENEFLTRELEKYEP